MWPHFVHLWWRIIHGMPALVSSNWASWLILIGSFLLTEGLLLWRERAHRKEWWDKRWRNLGLGLFVTVVVYTGLFLWSTVKTVYDDHHDSVGRWQSIVDEKNRLKTMLQQRDEYIKELEGKRCTVCASYPKSSAKEPQPRTLSDLQMTVLRRDLKAGAGLKVRINALGGKADTIAFADELRQAFRGWDVGGGNVGNHPGDPNEAQDLEFVIPHPEDRSVQIAVYAFEHAQIIYGKNVSPYAYSGPISLGEPPALTINVRDR